MDVGPILYADADSTASMMVERLQLAYVMFNEFDHAEFAIRTPTRIAEDGPAETLHYSKVVKRTAKQELFSLGE